MMLFGRIMACFCALATVASAAGPGDDAREMLRALMEKAKAPGVQAAVAVRGRTVWSEGIGLADVEQGVPVTRTTRFRIGSLSKLLTAGALAKLHERGQIDLDADIRTYVPFLPDRSQSPTVRQVAGHTAGIRNYSGSEFFSRERFADVVDAVKVFAGDPLLFEPGTKYAYATYNYTLLSAAIQSASGEPFLTHVRTRIIEPLNLTSTVPDYWERTIPGRAARYEKNRAGEIENAPFVDLSNKWAGGGYMSTADDLVTFGLAHTAPGFYDGRTLDLLFTPQRLKNGDPTIVGIGWRVAVDENGVTYAHHGGEASGGRAFILVQPATQSVVVFLTNLGGVPFAQKEALQLLALFNR